MKCQNLPTKGLPFFCPVFSVASEELVLVRPNATSQAGGVIIRRSDGFEGVTVLTLTLASLGNLAFLEVFSLLPEPMLTSSEPLRR